ncbi:MAG: MotA/TolQ/ExbB proton channel family protein [Gammaproteobacteria bacterium]
MNVEALFAKGGVVVWILAGYSCIALALILERLLQFALMRRPPRGFEQELLASLQEGKAGQLLQHWSGPEITVLRGIVEAAAAGVKDLTLVAIRLGSEQQQRMERGFRTLAVLGNTAPLLGLFGTILGMIKAFMVIEQAGGRVDAQALAGGIWEAMVTTGVGLAVSLPILLALHFLEGMADRRAQSMRNYASLIIEQLPHTGEADSESAVHHREGVIHAV